VVLGPTAPSPAWKPAPVFVDHTTASANVARELHEARPRTRPAASSTRRSPAARPARRTALLTVMCGGDAAAFDA
jgi:3-hydroxyisobutyrate dehydrogenase